MIQRLTLFLTLVALPGGAWAQAAIAGVVTDGTGGSLAGVGVTAASPALIEGTRTVVTDERGRYRIEDLRPGAYDVTFALAGWTTLRRPRVILTGSFTATVNAQLTAGPVTESLTVTTDVPVVDVHSTTRELTLPADVVRSLPTVRSYNALLVLVPGVVTSVNDTVTGTATVSFPVHGGRASDGRLMLDGFTVGSPPVSNSATSYAIDVGQAADVTFTTPGSLGEMETSGLVMNIVPKSGANVTTGSIFVSGTGARLQGDNLTQALRDQGLSAPTPLTGVYDVSGTIGGPIRDGLWYFVAGAIGGSRRESANVYYNLNAGDPSKWLYVPDSSRRSYSDRTAENINTRVTWQAASRHRITVFWDAQALCRTCTGATSGAPEPARVSPEAVGVLGRPLYLTQATWSSPLTNRLLVEAGYSGTFLGVGNFERDPNPTRDLVRVAEQCAAGCAANGNIPGLVYRSQDFSEAYTGSYLWKASAAYVTGSHNVHAGYQHTLMTDDRTWSTNTQSLTYRFSDGVPNQLTQSISPWVNNARVAWQAIYVDERWTRDRLTLQGAVRFDRAWSWFPVQQEGPSRFLPTPMVFPKTRGVDSYKDITPRFGLAFDVFGTGRTAVRVSAGKYLEAAGATGNYANTNPSLRMPQTTSVFGTPGVTRTWNDANRNFAPDCDLTNSSAQDLRPIGGDLCGIMSNASFGQNVLTNNFDSAVLRGWGVRPADWHLSVGVRQQIGRRSSLDVMYTRRSFDGFFAVDNLALEPADLTPFSIVAPVDPRLPGGGGYEVAGLYDVRPEKAGEVDNFVTDSSKFGAWTQQFNGIDAAVTIRFDARFTLTLGTSTGRTVADNCEVRGRLPELSTTTVGASAFGAGLANSVVSPVSPYCRVAYGLLTQARGFAWYAVPKLGVEVSSTFQSKPGAMLSANYAVPNADVAPRLGRDLSANAPNVTVNLLPPGSMYGDRINQLDIRLARSVRVGRSQTMFAIDVYNAINSSAVLTYNSTYVPGGPWLQPLTILSPRFLRLTAEIQF